MSSCGRGCYRELHERSLPSTLTLAPTTIDSQSGSPTTRSCLWLRIASIYAVNVQTDVSDDASWVTKHWRHILGDRRSPWRTPLFTGNHLPTLSILILALAPLYKFCMLLTHSRGIPYLVRASPTALCLTESTAFL